jgi:hypothetical protein
MTATSINHRHTHRPGLRLAAVAAVVGIAAGSVALSASRHDNVSGPQPTTTIAHQHDHGSRHTTSGSPATTSGGRVMLSPS